MTVKELIDMLREAKPEAEVLIWDGDAEEMLPVTGMVHDRVKVELCSDEP